MRRETFGKISIYTLFISRFNYLSLTYYVGKNNDTAFAISKPLGTGPIRSYNKSGKEKLASMLADQPDIATAFNA